MSRTSVVPGVICCDSNGLLILAGSIRHAHLADPVKHRYARVRWFMRGPNIITSNATPTQHAAMYANTLR